MQVLLNDASQVTLVLRRINILQISFTRTSKNKLHGMRDRRFIAIHRGGPLDRDSHVCLARWAADCAEQVLPFFVQGSGDPRPADALKILRDWANGKVKTGVAMKASVAAHAAARAATNPAAIAAARAAGQAVATAHAADHSMGALLYGLKALEASGKASAPELEKQLAKLPQHLQAQVSEGILVRLKGMGIVRVFAADTDPGVPRRDASLTPRVSPASWKAHD